MSQATIGSGPYRNSNLFSGYYLDERVGDLDAWDCDEEAEEAFEQIRDLWNKEGTLLSSYNEDELIDTWVAEVVDILGHGASSEVTLPDGGGYVDRLLFEDDDTRREGAKRARDGDHEGLFSRASAILEAKQWDADFEARFAEQRSYRDASHQIKYYLERTPSDLKWGVLTDGKKWRLYGTKDYETQTYYEVDLPEILESGDLEAFKYFFAFFRPEAFVETAGSSFLDDVWTESETAAQELGEDLQDNVFRALRVLGKGFVESNDLDVHEDGDVDRDELKEQSLVLLYRLMFVLYAESRGLIDPDDSAASEEYHEYFSLEAKREEILDDVEGMDVESSEAFTEEYSRFSTSIWGRLSELFELIDEGEESLDIPPYNGGLFSQEDHSFLNEYEVKDPYIAEVVYWLSTTENEEGEHVPADYADLDTRHLGSIYEGLLEHEFRIADAEGVAAVSEDGGQIWKPASEVTAAEAVEIVEEGGLYVVNDEGERKATGAYYTPDYVVTYIVEETVDPLIEEIDEGLRDQGLEPSDREYFVNFWQEVQDLTILDPAMGSGHFLTKATGYLTEQVMEVVREQEIQSYDEQDIRRTISKEVIYGVDLNGMAVELSKLSMWLETLAADQPLAFLDHHLKDGNSLVGSDITEVLSDDTEENGGQLTLTQAFARVRQDTLGHVMDLMADLLAYDNDSLESVKSMEELYDEIRDDPLYTRLFELANVHTAEEFGCDVPDDAYEQMAGAIEDEGDWAEIREEDWFTAAQATADEQDFFHWELEFPEVFFDSEGEKMAEAGFDAVVGNPPYARIQLLPDTMTSYLSNRYESASGSYDLYVPFIEHGANLASGSGEFGYIVPNKIYQVDYGVKLREILSDRVAGVADFGSNQVFAKAATTYTTILRLHGSSRAESFSYWELADDSDPETILQKIGEEDWTEISCTNESLTGSPWNFLSAKTQTVVESSSEVSTPLGDLVDGISRGVSSGEDTVFEVKVEEQHGNTIQCTSSAHPSPFEIEESLLRTPIHSTDFDKYSFESEEGKKLIWPYNGEYELRSVSEFEELYPNTWDYLTEHREALEDRSDYSVWYDYSAPRNLKVHDNGEILIPLLASSPAFTRYPEPQSDYVLMASGGFSISLKPTSEYSTEYVLSLINSKLLFLHLRSFSNVFRGGYVTCTKQYFKKLPIRNITFDTPESTRKDSVNQALEAFFDDLEEDLQGAASTLLEKSKSHIDNDGLDIVHDILAELTDEIIQWKDRYENYNLTLLDYIGQKKYAISISEVGLTQPTQDPTGSKLVRTSEEWPNLRVGTARVDRESPNTVLIEATARYKPDDEGAHETDQWGYTETEYLPAFRITDLTEREADLIEHFVPVAVDEAGGFANFRETATKTNSLIDRLKAIEVPDVDDVADDLENYLETKERAEELDAKIEQTDELIDEIVYELYGLTDEEIEIVEEAVGE